MDEPLIYPMHLNADDIARLLPHRGDMQLVKSLVVLDHDHYQGHACWAEDSAMLRGHFPGFPLVPGVLLVELVAQVAGAGMRAGSPVVRRLGDGYLGVLATIRKCNFRRPVLPGDTVLADVRSRAMSDTAAAVSGIVSVDGDEAAQVELLLVNAPRATVEANVAALRAGR